MSRFRLHPVRTVAEFEPFVSAWNELAEGVPFREPTWLLTWWKYFGNVEWGRPACRLFSFVVLDGDEVVALAPWYVEWSTIGGAVIRPLGAGAVCSDYLTILCRSGEELQVGTELAEYLSETVRHEWDRFDFDGATLGDRALGSFFEALAARGAEVERRPGLNCWRIMLPDTWEAYLGTLSKSHRKKLRRLISDVVDTPRVVWHTTTQAAEFDRDWTIFVDLHQRRRRSLGEPGCFTDPTFAAFHEEVARQFLEQGRLLLHRLEIDGRAAAVEYQFAGPKVVYAYQAGLDPDRIELEPGRIASVAAIRGAIENGFTHYDFLRGDEPYKAHWRAKPFPTENISIASPRTTSRLRFALRKNARKIHRAFRNGLAAKAAESQESELNETQPATSA